MVEVVVMVLVVVMVVMVVVVVVSSSPLKHFFCTLPLHPNVTGTSPSTFSLCDLTSEGDHEVVLDPHPNGGT